jgi:hypothetical protein
VRWYFEGIAPPKPVAVNSVPEGRPRGALGQYSLKLSFSGKHGFQASGYHAGARDAHVLREGIRSREKTGIICG